MSPQRLSSIRDIHNKHFNTLKVHMFNFETTQIKGQDKVRALKLAMFKAEF